MNGGGKNRNKDGNTMNGGVILAVSASAAAFSKWTINLSGALKYTQRVELGIRGYKGKTPYSEEEPSS